MTGSTITVPNGGGDLLQVLEDPKGGQKLMLRPVWPAGRMERRIRERAATLWADLIPRLQRETKWCPHDVTPLSAKVQIAWRIEEPALGKAPVSLRSVAQVPEPSLADRIACVTPRSGSRVQPVASVGDEGTLYAVELRNLPIRQALPVDDDITRLREYRSNEEGADAE